MAMMDTAHIRALAEEYAIKYNPDQVAPFPYDKILKDRNDLEIFFVDFGEGGPEGIELLKESIGDLPIKSIILGRVEKYFDLKANVEMEPETFDTNNFVKTAYQ